MHFSRTTALCLLLVVNSCARANDISRVEGVAASGPINPGPLANVAFLVKQDEKVVVSFTTDERGRFRLALAPGHYIASRKGEWLGQCGPFAFDVLAGPITKLEWQCDNSTALRRGPADR